MNKITFLVLVIIGLAMVLPAGRIHALNDMPLIAQLQGEHNASAFGFSIMSLDFNHDYYDDLIVYSAGYGWVYPYTPSHGKVYIYYGGPSFSSESEPAMTLEGDYPEGMDRIIGSIINPGDTNGDGFDDLIIVDRNPDVTGSVRLMFYFGGTSDLSSPDRIEYPLLGESFYNVYELGDVDGDGYGDVGICYHINYYTFFDIMWGGSFTRQNIHSLDFTSGAPEGSIIGIGDINNDGYRDFSIGYCGEPVGSDQYSTIRVYYGNSSRVFADYILLSYTPYVITTTCRPLGDLNNDGFDDFLGYINNSGMKIWFGTSTSLSSSPNVILNPILFGNSGLGGVKHGDFNGDGFSDVVGASYQARRFAVWLGSSVMNGYPDWQKVNTLENYGYDAAVGDFNADGYDDTAVSAPFEEGIWPYHDYRGYVFIYTGNPDIVANDDPTTPAISDNMLLILSPNPITRASQVLNVELKGATLGGSDPTVVEIFNIKGQSVQREEFPSQTGARTFQIAISSLSNGLYFCLVISGNHQVVRKLSVIK